MAATERTLPALFEQSVLKFGDNTFMWEKRDGAYTPSTYKEIQTKVYECAAGLISIGVNKGDRIALISEGRNDWVISELGMLYAGAIDVPLSVKIEELSELQFRLAHSGCRFVIVSGNHAGKVEQIRRQLPDLEKIILLDMQEPKHDYEIAYPKLLEAGKMWLEAHRPEFENTWQSIRENDPANICYTSGTTADPKGIVLTHRNYTANIEQSIALYPLPESFVTLLILPWDHAFAHSDGIYALGACGGSIASVQVGKTATETLKNIPGNIKELRPTFLLSVPALAKNFRKNIEAGVRAKGAVVEWLLNLGLKIAFTYIGNGFNRGKGWRMLLKPTVIFFDLILFRKIRANFGGRLQYFIGGGALLDVELQRFFFAIGMPMYQGYGLTEAAPVISANTPQKHKFGTSGVLVPDLQLRICDEHGHEIATGETGEIVVKGENVMAGYWKNEKATSETLREGWLYTGDLGYVDPDGFLVVLGREKSLLIGHDGEKYSPEGIEETIVGESPFIDQIMLYNSQSSYTVAIIVPNREALLNWLKHRHLSAQTIEGQDAALGHLQSEIDAYREDGRHERLFPERWLPAAIAVREEPFTEQNRFLNSTLKMVRGRIVEAHKHRLEYLFTSEGKNIWNRMNREAIEALLNPQSE
jgi:long-chain acyl-CoA synthetase